MKKSLHRCQGFIGSISQLTIKLCLLSATVFLLQGCSPSSSSSGDGGITGTGSPLENYMKHGLQQTNQLQTGCSSCPVVAIEDATSNPTSDNAAKTNNVSTTNVQVAGVDELDVIKTDTNGDYAYRLTGYLPTSTNSYAQKLSIFELNSLSGKQTPLSSVTLDRNIGDGSIDNTEGLYLHQTESTTDVVLLSSVYKSVSSPIQNSNLSSLPYFSPSDYKTGISIYSVSDLKDKLSHKLAITLDGQFTSSRKIGQKLYVVSEYHPSLPGYVYYPRTDDEIKQNTTLINQTAVKDLLPNISFNGQSEKLITEADCHIPENPETSTRASLAIVTVFDLDNPRSFHSSCVAADIATIYVSSNNVYLVENQYRSNQSKIYQLALTGSGSQDGSDIQDGSSIQYKASVTVEGNILWDRFRLNEYNQYLRVVTSIGNTHQLHIFKLSEGNIQAVSSLPNEQRPDPIGKPGERIQSVNYLADRAYIVTFRNTDPFYVLDLKDPEQPKIAGALTLPGFSSYLRPLNNNLIFGIGKLNSDMKVTLFDVSTVENPIVIDEVILSGSYSSSSALSNPKAISFLPNTESTEWRVSFPAITYGLNGSWKQDALYLFELKMDTHPDGASLALHGSLIGADGTSNSSGFSLGSSYDKGIFKNDFVHYFYNEALFSEDWFSTSLTLK